MEHKSICKTINNEINLVYKKYAEGFRPIWLEYKNAYINLLTSVYNSDAFQKDADKKYTTYNTAELVIQILCSKFQQRLAYIYKKCIIEQDKPLTQEAYVQFKYNQLAENKEIYNLVNEFTQCRNKLCDELNMLVNEPDIKLNIMVFNITDDMIIFGFSNGMGCEYCAHNVLKFMKYVAEDTTEDALLHIKI